MACSRVPGPLNFMPGAVGFGARSPGPLGLFDQADPNWLTLLGDTPGVLGQLDGADPMPPLSAFGCMARLASGTAVKVPAGGQDGKRDYLWNGSFTPELVEAGFAKHLKGDPRYDTRSLPHLKTLLGFIEADPDVSDLRWMAYLLATAYWETSHIEVVATTVKDKKGKEVVKKRKHWVNMGPVEETGHGAGRKYHLPVKVESSGAGARVTEQDGDQFDVAADGTYKSSKKGMAMGSAADGKASQAYKDAKGAELAYYGRGYVQLTWWANYASAGANLGRGLELLLEPEKVLEPGTAYALMSYGMRTGKGFANGHKLADYFSGTNRDYTGARRMVNGTDHAADIAAIAEKFEDLLWEARAL